MSNLDPHRYGLYREISIAAEIDDDWCAAITEAYSRGDYRTVLQATYFYAFQTDRPCTLLSSSKSIEKVIVADPDSDGILLDGTLNGARLFPIPFKDKDGDEYFEYLPYAIMTDVVTLPEYEGQESTKVSDPGEQLFIPIDIYGGGIALYSQDLSFN